jgi:hypothetical protein
MIWQVNVQGNAPFDTVSVSQPVTPYSAQLTLAGFLAVLDYANTYFSDASIPASNSDQRLPFLQITTSSVVMNVAHGDGPTVQAELLSLLAEAGNVS